MKLTIKHLSEIILAIVAIMLVVGIVLCLASPIGGLFTGIIDKESNAANGVFNYGSYDGTGSGGGNQGGGGGGSETVTAGLYETGSNYTVLLTSWDDLVADGTVHVENGVVYTNMDMNTWENASSDALAGDLMLPNDGSITALGNLAWDDTIYNEEYDEYGDYTGNAAFGGCYNLTGIVIPNSVTSIGDNAFGGCTSLESIDIPNSVTTIGEYAFSACGLTDVTIPDSVTSIGDSAFRDCTSLTSVTIPYSVTSIGDVAFQHCTSLTNITIPKGVTSIGDNAFGGCTSLTTIKFKGTMAQWNAITLGWGWNYNVPTTTVRCSNGTVVLS